MDADTTLDIKAPGKCIHCKKTTKQMDEKYGVGLMVFQIPNSVFVFFQCPFCHGLMGNTQAAANALKIRKAKAEQSRIIKPGGPGKVLTMGGK